jgi:membrane protein insertase, YidC/Oxa1 family, N-terminal domain
MDKRTILAIVLSLAVLLIYQLFFIKPPVQKQATPAQESKQISKDTAVKTPDTMTMATASKPAIQQTVAKKEAAPKDIKVETENYTAIFSTRGAAVKSFQLKGYKKECTKCTDDIYPAIKNSITGTKQPAKAKSNEPIELVALNESMPYPLAITFPESSPEINADSVYDVNVTSLDMKNSKEKTVWFFHVPLTG